MMSNDNEIKMLERQLDLSEQNAKQTGKLLASYGRRLEIATETLTMIQDSGASWQGAAARTLEAIATEVAKMNDPGTTGIHPSPTEFTPAQIADDPILRFFHYAHLPPKLQNISQPFCELANELVSLLPRNAERSAALRKLLEAKDCAVRANLP